MLVAEGPRGWPETRPGRLQAGAFAPQASCGPGAPRRPADFSAARSTRRYGVSCRISSSRHPRSARLRPARPPIGSEPQQGRPPPPPTSSATRGGTATVRSESTRARLSALAARARASPLTGSPAGMCPGHSSRTPAKRKSLGPSRQPRRGARKPRPSGCLPR